MADDTKPIIKDESYYKSLTDIIVELSKTLGQFIDPLNLNKYIYLIINRPDFDSIVHNKKSFPFTTAGKGQVDNEILSDVAFNIAAAHDYYTTPISNPKQKIAILNDASYSKRLQDVVIENCKLRQLLQYNQQITGLNHTPILYIIQALTEQLYSKLGDIGRNVQYFKKEKQFQFSCFDKMIRTIKSLVTILVDDDYYNAFTLLRTLIEALFVYLTLKDNSVGIRECEKFLNYRIEYENGGSKEYPKEFLDKFEQCKDIRGINKTNFLDYGWLNAIDPDNKKFCFESVYNHCEDEEFKKNNLLQTYKFCNKFVHGNLFGFRNTKDSLFMISASIALILNKVATLFCDTFGEECKCDDIDLIHCLEQRLVEHKKIMSYMPQFIKKK